MYRALILSINILDLWIRKQFFILVFILLFVPSMVPVEKQSHNWVIPVFSRDLILEEKTFSFLQIIKNNEK